MAITFDSAVHLLHGASWGGLATQSAHVPGYPFATIVPYALDEQHLPLFLISDLAEHTKNLLADKRASFVVQKADDENVLAGERISIVGNVAPTTPADALVARYLRYHPDGEQYLALAGFHFFRLEPTHARYIAGFGQMRWIDGAEWLGAETLPIEEETALIFAVGASMPSGARLLGVDRYGFDYEKAGNRERQRFADAPIAKDRITEVVRRFVAAT